MFVIGFCGRKLARIIEEIVDFENNFNQTVGKGLKNYLHVSHSESSAYLELIRNNQFKIFGNIEEIHRFHKDIFYPKLLQCAGDIHKIFDMFLNFIKDGHFYCYVTYAMNSMNFQKIWAENRDTINERQHEVKDSLGLHALLAEPIQHLTRYTLFFVKITDKFPKKLDDIDDSIKRSFLAERQIKNYVQMVNNSMKIHDIKQCYEVCACNALSYAKISFELFLEIPSRLISSNKANSFGWMHSTLSATRNQHTMGRYSFLKIVSF